MKYTFNNMIGSTLLPFFLLGCSSSKSSRSNEPNKSESTYEIERIKTRSGDGQIINIQLYEYEDKSRRWPFTFAIANGILVKDSIIRVATGTKSVNVKIYQFLKHPLSVDVLNISRGDSLVIKAYLKDANTVFD